MPTRGRAHDDQTVRDLAAFLQKLPELAPDQYREMVKRGDETRRHIHPHSHEDDSENKHHH